MGQGCDSARAATQSVSDGRRREPEAADTRNQLAG